MDTVRRHHVDQKLIAKNMVAEMWPLWGILQFHDLQETSKSWLKSVRPVIERAFLSSQFVAAQFYHTYRAESLPEAPRLEVDLPNPFGAFGISPAPDKSESLRIMVSMRVTGPIWVANKSFPGITEEAGAELMEAGFSKSSGAAIRLALNGGRGMVKMMVDADQMARGVIGVADPESCESCLFLASEPLLKGIHTQRQMNAVAVGHDYCTCSSRPVFN